MAFYSSILTKEQLLHFFKIIELTVTQAFWAISFIAVNTEIAVLVPCNNILASEAFTGSCVLILCDHATLVLISRIPVFFNTLHVNAKTHTVLLPLVQDEFIR